jgi:hypothetical protein
MANFAMLIECAIAHHFRDKLLAFLSQHQVVELGRQRKLTLAEASLVLTCIDQFFTSTSFADLGVAEITNLQKRLEQIAHDDQQELSVRSASFDALACIAALEARFCQALKQHELRSINQAANQRPANEN